MRTATSISEGAGRCRGSASTLIGPPPTSSRPRSLACAGELARAPPSRGVRGDAARLASARRVDRPVRAAGGDLAQALHRALTERPRARPAAGDQCASSSSSGSSSSTACRARAAARGGDGRSAGRPVQQRRARSDGAGADPAEGAGGSGSARRRPGRAARGWPSDTRGGDRPPRLRIAATRARRRVLRAHGGDQHRGDAGSRAGPRLRATMRIGTGCGPRRRAHQRRGARGSPISPRARAATMRTSGSRSCSSRCSSASGTAWRAEQPEQLGRAGPADGAGAVQAA